MNQISTPRTGPPEHIAVIGGGIAGMAVAHYLVGEGRAVTLFEASDQFGGLGTFFPYRDGFLERFYHCMLPGDNNLMSLLGDLGIEDRVYWHSAEFGFMHRGRLFGLNTPLELLKFTPLPFLDRIRVGLVALYASSISSKGLDDISSEQWLIRLCGKRAFELFWKPMFQAKFGDRYHDVPALWFWTRFNREKGTKKEVKGYIRGGYKFLTERLVASLQERGVQLRVNTPVESLDLDERGLPVVGTGGKTERFDRVVSTAPLVFFRKIARGKGILPWAEKVDESIDYQGVINVVLLLKNGLTDYYWIAAMDEEVPYQGIVESSVLLEKEDTGGFHLVYLMNYTHRSEPLYAKSDDAIADDYVRGLKAMFPTFKETDIIDRFVFRAPFVEPLYTRGYLGKKPTEELVPGRVYLATSSQVYPAVTSWDSSTGLARKLAGLILNGDKGSAS